MALAVQVSRSSSRVRVESVERWQKAFVRALESGVDAIELAYGAGWAVPSSGNQSVVYLVNGDATTCTCQAGQAGDPICWHRAMCRYFLGALPGSGPDPEPTAPLVRPRCQECGGRGVVEIWGNHGLSDYTVEHCGRCGGTGDQPTLEELFDHDRAVRTRIRTAA